MAKAKGVGRGEQGGAGGKKQNSLQILFKIVPALFFVQSTFLRKSPVQSGIGARRRRRPFGAAATSTIAFFFSFFVFFLAPWAPGAPLGPGAPGPLAPWAPGRPSGAPPGSGGPSGRMWFVFDFFLPGRIGPFSFRRDFRAMGRRRFLFDLRGRKQLQTVHC